MVQRTAKPAVSARVLSYTCVSVIAACAVAAVVLQGRYPISDNALFEYVGRAIARGHSLYRDVWDNKLPGVYYVNALWQKLFGEDYALHAIAETCLAMASVTLFGAVARTFELKTWLPAAAVLAFVLCIILPLNISEGYALPLLLASVLAALQHRPLLCGCAIGLAAAFWLPSVFMTAPFAAFAPACLSTSAAAHLP
jgi:hypothetical protein